MEENICEAIRNRNLIEFNYDSLPRVVEPFALGISTKNKKVLRAYQIEGRSIKTEIPGWGLFSLDKIVNLQVTDRKFDGSRAGYKRGDSVMSHIFCEI